jgi:hypothetical protein
VHTREQAVLDSLDTYMCRLIDRAVQTGWLSTA